jgi:hypothetical protein
MAFELIGPTEQASIGLCDELLFDVVGLPALRGPLIARRWKEFYDEPSFTPEEAHGLADELKALLEILRSKPELPLAAWEARPPAYRSHCEPPRPGDLARKCGELIAVCEEAARHGRLLRSLSD